jgi:hypothetical protein
MAIKDAPVVDIIEFDVKDAYDPDRPISSLIRTQLLHLHHAEHLVLPQNQQTNVNINTLHTERQASEYIQRVTALLHRHGKKAAKKPRTKKRPTKKAAGKKNASNSKKKSTQNKRTSGKARRK